MNRKKLIEKYISFFEKKDHKKIPNASLIPENDPTVLFTTAGMHPLVPFLSGEAHPLGKRLVGLQRCIRTGDIEEVGDTTHHTFFEMLGNWGLGDYGKEDAITYSFEFLTKVLKIPKDRLAVSVFVGEKKVISPDFDSAKIWNDLGINRIIALGREDNWWGPAGKTGPCGPDTEMFYWRPNKKPVPKKFDPNRSTLATEGREWDQEKQKWDEESHNWVEIWNDVFMEYVKDEKGYYVESKQKNVDTGMGVERTVAILKGLEDNYLADMWKPIIEKIEMISKRSYTEDEVVTRAMRIIADHIKAAVFMIHDGVIPGNTEQGYVLRRLIRRAIRFGRGLGIENFTTKIADVVYMIYKDYKLNAKKISLELQKEEDKFLKTLEQGLRVFEKITARGKDISGEKAFLLFQSYGFPIEMTKELAFEEGLTVDVEGYEKAFSTHQKLSRTASAGKFKSGLGDHSKETTRLHTATHLLLSALNVVLKREDGEVIQQRGSNITKERARFDFSWNRKLTEEEITEIERLVNSWMQEGSDVTRKEMNLDEAREFGAAGIFGDTYSKADVISVYVVGDGSISKEMCTGPHVKSLKEFDGLNFKIVKQKSVGSGVRRVRVELVRC